MSQVYFTTYFSEWGKGSREGYSIYYYARAGVRASGSCKNEPERWKNIPKTWKSLPDGMEKIWKDSTRKGKMVHPQGKFMLKKADFSFEKIQEKRKKYRNGQKNFSVPLGKRQEKLFRRSEKISENGWSGWKNSRLFFASGRKKCRKGCEAGQKNLP